MSETTDDLSPITRPEDVEDSPQGTVRRWLAELNIADRTEKDWRAEVKELWELYEGGKKKAHSFNIFWSNTETLLPAIYNSTPEPDVRRRYRDPDPVGKAVSDLLERSLSYQIDDYDFDSVAESFALDMLVTGRGVTRIKYEPKFMAFQAPEGTAAAGGDMEDPGEQEPQEKLAGESVECECVQWDDFRRGPGKRWEEVPWVAFRHDFTQDMAEDKFGPEIAGDLTYSETKDSKEISDQQTREIFKTVEVWEIWDKEERRVLFIAPSYSKQPLMVAQDPLTLAEFFPCPRPAYAIKQTRSLVPIPLYKLYEEQAKELNLVSARINKIITALKVRGAYSSNLSEVRGILEGGDNEMVAVQNVSELASVGGLDKAIWIMPLDHLKGALDGLYLARDQIKSTIYEITGISDIIRGSTNAHETASAQELKSKWGSMRLQRLQREVQRVIRDLIRLKAEVIAERFTPETLSQVTNLSFPTLAEKQQVQLMAQQAQSSGMEVPPEMQQKGQEILSKPAWEEILQVMRQDGLRQYRVDVETDSTIAATLNQDMQGLSEVMASVGGVLQAVPMGLPPEVAKEVSLAIVRRARLGSAVEDALESFEQPPPEDPTAQIEATKASIMEIIKGEGAKQVQAEQAAHDQQLQTQQVGNAVQQIGPAVEQISAAVGQVGEQAVGGLQELAARQDQQAQMIAQLGQGLQQMQAGLQQMAEIMQRPKSFQFNRGPDNKIVGGVVN